MLSKLEQLEQSKSEIEAAIEAAKAEEAREQKKWRKVLKVQRSTGEFVGYADSWEEADRLGYEDSLKRMQAAQRIAGTLGVEVCGAHVQSADYEIVEVWRHVAD